MIPTRGPLGAILAVLLVLAWTIALITRDSTRLRTWSAKETVDLSDQDEAEYSKAITTTQGAVDDLASTSINAAPIRYAVVVETDIVPVLIPIIEHFSTVLGPNWTILLFTLESNYGVSPSRSFQRLLQSGQVEIRFLPPDTQLKDSHSVSTFLTRPWFWQQLLESERILLFQSDSILCSKGDRAVEDFFQWDFLGAPIAPQYGQGYNGGLSLRNPKLFLDIVTTVDFQTSGADFEDQFFYAQIKKRAELQPGSVSLPDADTAKTFSVETIDYPTPLGYHQPQRWQGHNMPQIEEYCPEVRMLIGRRAT